ncbi:hypothetical protein ASA1KI_32850 [Opitutales bacterium ASA1]|nr:hypothetical protein ASA1KI_32850 [Opitutales bacterium ASA1]
MLVVVEEDERVRVVGQCLLERAVANGAQSAPWFHEVFDRATIGSRRCGKNDLECGCGGVVVENDDTQLDVTRETQARDGDEAFAEHARAAKGRNGEEDATRCESVC